MTPELLNDISNTLSEYKETHRELREEYGRNLTTAKMDGTGVLRRMRERLDNFCRDLVPAGWGYKFARGLGRPPAPESFYVAILPPRQKPSNGIYTAICFAADGGAIVIGCCRSGNGQPELPDYMNNRLGLEGVQGIETINEDFIANFFADKTEVFRRRDGVWNETDCKNITSRIVQANEECLKILEAITRKEPAMDNGNIMEQNCCNLSDVEKMVKKLLEQNFNVILTGAPGTGKTFIAKKVACAITGDTNDASQEESHIASVQFHPGYDYSDFVGGLKPKLVGGQVTFEWVDGIFKKFADEAKNHLDKEYVLIIDEINRADLSRVFGELFSLLEEDYRYSKEDGNEKNAKGVVLPNGNNFVIPKNLYIIGTMNDIDRSVESMDFALRRRFAWYEVTADSSKHIIGCKVLDQGATEKLKSAMTSLNECISGKRTLTVDGSPVNLGGILGSAFELGGAIFAKYEKYKGNGDAYEKLWDNHIKNILSEYLRGRRGRDDKLLPALKQIFDEAVKDQHN